MRHIRFTIYCIFLFTAFYSCTNNGGEINPNQDKDKKDPFLEQEIVSLNTQGAKIIYPKFLKDKEGRDYTEYYQLNWRNDGPIIFDEEKNILILNKEGVMAQNLHIIGLRKAGKNNILLSVSSNEAEHPHYFAVPVVANIKTGKLFVIEDGAYRGLFVYSDQVSQCVSADNNNLYYHNPGNTIYHINLKSKSIEAITSDSPYPETIQLKGVTADGFLLLSNSRVRCTGGKEIEMNNRVLFILNDRLYAYSIDKQKQVFSIFRYSQTEQNNNLKEELAFEDRSGDIGQNIVYFSNPLQKSAMFVSYMRNKKQVTLFNFDDQTERTSVYVDNQKWNEFASDLNNPNSNLHITLNGLFLSTLLFQKMYYLDYNTNQLSIIQPPKPYQFLGLASDPSLPYLGFTGFEQSSKTSITGTFDAEGNISIKSKGNGDVGKEIVMIGE